MNDNNGEDWIEQYLSSTREISSDSSLVEENKYFENIAQEIIIATEQYAKHNIFNFQCSIINVQLDIENQVKYYEKNSTANKRYYYYFKTSEISISVVIPFLTGYINDNDYIKYIIGGLSVILALLTGLEVLFKFQDKWITYRATSESLNQEKYMFLSKAGSYKNDQSLSNLSERVETILAKENSTWNQIMNKEEKQNG